MAQLYLCKDGSNVDMDMAIEIDEEAIAEDAVGATPCNTPEVGAGKQGVERRRRVTVGCGVRPGRLMKGAGVDGGVGDGEVVVRDWAVRGD